MKLELAPYWDQASTWPTSGRRILAQFDEEKVIVYQAFRHSIGEAAVADQRFGGGGWSFGRMSWIKPSFLWMMYRRAWGTAPGQEIVLAVHLRRSALDEILQNAVHSHHAPDLFESQEQWIRAIKTSDVRVQWDPDRTPAGGRQERRAIQLGLRGSVLVSYAKQWIVMIEDISDFVREQKLNLAPPSDRRVKRYGQLLTPLEREYPVHDAELAARLQLSLDVTT